LDQSWGHPANFSSAKLGLRIVPVGNTSELGVEVLYTNGICGFLAGHGGGRLHDDPILFAQHERQQLDGGRLRHSDFTESGRSRSFNSYAACASHVGIDGRLFPETAEKNDL